jgi:PIN domain nuclease of toxin-antitoxin system
MEASHIIYLDTHVVVWLYADKGKRLSASARRFIEESQSILISPMVLLELDFLYEINRITCGSGPVFAYLHERIHLEICKKPFFSVVAQASDQSWTRDPFDRLITAHAALDENILITKDETIRNHYANSAW